MSHGAGAAPKPPHAALALHATLRAPPAPPCVYVFARGPVLVGRGLSCEICVPLPAVSVHHLTLTWSPEGLTARDAHSKNKAEARGAPITAEAPLLAGAHAVITLPGARLELRLAPLESAPTTPKERSARTAQLWRPESGWLLRWSPPPPPPGRVAPTSPLPPAEAHPGAPPSAYPSDPLAPPEPELSLGDARVEPAAADEGARLWTLPFGERLSLRDARYGNGEGLPSALLATPTGPSPASFALSLEVTPQGISISPALPSGATGAPLTLTPGAHIPWRGGQLTLSAPAAPEPPSEAGEVDPLNHRLLLFLPRPWAFRLLLALLIGALAVLLRALRGEGGL